MFALARDVHSATGVELAVSCYFFSASSPEKNLVVASVNCLRVYRLATYGDVEDDKSSSRGDATKEATAIDVSRKAKLECMAKYDLFGEIADLAVVKFAGSSRDSLVICFRDAKASVVEYDPYTHSLKTVSLHYFEEEAVANGWTENHYIPRVVVDPENRAAAISFFGSKIAVIPFRKDVLGTAAQAGAQAQANATADGESTDEMPSPVMTSYIIDLKTVDSKMDYVIDLQFLHGYYEPTLLVLFEPLRTYSGRVMLRPDTCQMVAMSLNTADGSHPVIWSVGGLPFDCMQAIPVARPIGGCLIVAVNSLIYLNQSMPPYGVAVNCIPATTTGFPLKPLTQEGVTLAMDCARSAFMKEPDVLALSVANGDLWVITLISDGMMAVRGFHFDKAATAVVATCLSVVEQGFMFVGSRLGNSQLLRYIPKDQIRLDIVKKEALLTNGPSAVAEKEATETDAKEDDEKSEDGPPTKKKRKKEEGKSDLLADWVASGVDELDDADEVEVYFGPEEDGAAKSGLDVAGVKAAEQILSFANFATGEGQSVVNQIVNYAFESCDSLINIGPCGKLSLGQPAFLSQEFWSNDRHDLDLLTSSGYGKGGALCVMHRSLRPQVITTFELPGCVDMWTVVGEKSNGFHSFLIMSLVNSSMVLETGVELNEVESGGFVTSKPTVYACNIGNNRFIVQVTAFSMVLLRGKDVVHTTQVDIKNPIILARVADPYLVLLGAGGEVKLAKLMEPRGTAKAYMDVVAGLPIQQSRAVAISTFTDLSGMFAAAGPGYSGVTPAGVAPRAGAAGLEVELDGPGATVDGAEATSSLFETGGELLDEDELLYGESDSILLTAFTEKQDAASASKPKQKRTNGAPLVTQWLFLVRQNGNLEIYSLPDFSTKFLARGFALAPYVLTNSMTDTWVESRIHDVPQVKEILVVGLGLTKGAGKSPASLRPMMFAFVGDDLLIYEAFPFFEGRSIDDPYIKVRFRKIEHDYIAHPNATGRPIVKQEKGTYNASRLIYFSEIGASASYSGVFVSGVYPHWALMGARGDLKIHPMSIDGPVKCFAPFHNVNCPNGFLYFNHKEEMRICLMPAQMNYDCSWPTRKVPLKSTPRFLVYHVETKTYAVATSSETESHTMYKFNGEDKELVEEIRPENFPLPYVTSFALQLFSPVSWDVIPETKIPMEEYEHITDMKNVALIYEGAASGLKGYIGIATNFVYGEDITCRGRILIMDILDVVPEPGRPLTRNKLKQLYGKEQKGPVTAIAAVKGFLVSAIGQKIYIWQLKDNDLVGIAFVDTQIYTHQMICLKNFILVADMFKSITLLQFQEKYRTICVVARDIHPLEVYGVEFFVCDKTLGFVASDRERNLAVFAYQPEARENSGVSRLVRRADVHIGSNINQMFRIKAKASDPSGCLRPGQPKFGDKRQITWYGTLDGGLGYLLPLHEVQYRVLTTVQNVLHTLMPHLGGLNPKGHRTYRSAGRRGPLGNVNPARNVVDGNLVFKYLHLPLPDKLEVTKRTGMPIEDIVDVLQECARVTDHF